MHDTRKPKARVAKTLKTYSLYHNKEKELLDLLYAYRQVLNQILRDIHTTIHWKAQPIKGKKQQRLLPTYRKDTQFRRELRNHYLAAWEFSAHWVDSALKTAYAIMDSWKRNYLKGQRSRNCPQTKRLFARIKQTLLRLDGDTLRISVKPRRFVEISLSKRYFKLPKTMSATALGEPIITPDTIHLPIHLPLPAHRSPEKKPEPEKRTRKMAWDSNMSSLDGFSPATGWVKIDTRPLATVHIAAFEKRRNVQRKVSHSKKAGRVLQKYRRREGHRAKKHQLEITRAIKPLAEIHGFEKLHKQSMYQRSRVWNRRIMRTDWRGIRRLVGGEELPPQGTSKTCSLCRWRNRDLRGTRLFVCQRCGLTIDRQLNAAINLYLRMEGVPHHPTTFFRSIVRPLVRSVKKRRRGGLMTVVGGYVLTGAEQKTADELVRPPSEALKPQIYIAYDRHADAYLPTPM
jgi:putative transposase